MKLEESFQRFIEEKEQESRLHTCTVEELCNVLSSTDLTDSNLEEIITAKTSFEDLDALLSEYYGRYEQQENMKLNKTAPTSVSAEEGEEKKNENMAINDLTISDLKEKTGIISPESGNEYTISNLFDKFLERGKIEIGEFDLNEVTMTSYGDKDLLLHIDIWSRAQMTNSASVNLKGKIPLHVDYAGKLSVGFGCGKGIQDSKKEKEVREKDQREAGGQSYVAITAYNEDITYSTIHDQKKLGEIIHNFSIEEGKPYEAYPNREMTTVQAFTPELGESLRKIIKEVMVRNMLSN